MDNQSSTGGSIVPVKKNGENLVDEKIDEIYRHKIEYSLELYLVSILQAIIWFI